MIKSKWGLDKNNILRLRKTAGVSYNTDVGAKITAEGQATDKNSSG